MPYFNIKDYAKNGYQNATHSKSIKGDLVLDPFAGSGTTLKVAKELKRNFVGYEIYEHYKSVIEEKLHCHKLFA